jgi:DnaJ-class molecular chaperone
MAEKTLDMQARTKDLYQILGVADDASLRQIGEARKRRLKAVHPDTGNVAADADDASAEVNLAYDMLKEPHLRAEYDRDCLPDIRSFRTGSAQGTKSNSEKRRERVYVVGVYEVGDEVRHGSFGLGSVVATRVVKWRGIPDAAQEVTIDFRDVGRRTIISTHVGMSFAA